MGLFTAFIILSQIVWKTFLNTVMYTKMRKSNMNCHRKVNFITYICGYVGTYHTAVLS